MRRALTLAGAVAAAATAAVEAQPLTEPQIRRIDSVFAAVDGTSRPGCALGVARQGVPLYLRGYGMSDLQHGVAITPRSIFHVASISKQFAAFAVALLAQDGRLSLDDPVRRHVPELPPWADRITIRQMIHHTSGVRDQWELLGLAGWRYPADLFTQGDVLAILSRQRALNFAPGTEYLYSNGAYTLLAVIVERVSGRSLRAFSQERIFEPLGMRDTHVHDDHTMVVPGRTAAYQRAADGTWHQSLPVFDTHGATSLFTTAADLLRWEHNFVTGAVGGRALVAEAETTGRLADGSPTNYGFGIALETYRGARAAGHGGSDAGYRADVVRFPDHGVAIGVLCNFAEAVPSQLARSVADVVLGDQLAAAPAEPEASGSASPADVARAAGVYRRPGTDLAWEFEERDGALVLVTWGVRVAPLGPRRFTAFGAVVDFFGPPTGPAGSVRVRFGGATLDSMVRVPAWRPSPVERRAAGGRYWSDELGVAYEVAVRDTALVLRRPKHGEVALRPAFESAFLAPGIGTVRLVRQGGRVTGLALSGNRVRNVSFIRLPADSPVR